MKPTPEQLANCLAQLTRFIPQPARKKALERKTKWGLKVGQPLTNLTGEQLTVVGADSLGLTLETPDGRVYRIEDQAQLSALKKVAKRRERSRMP